MPEVIKPNHGALKMIFVSGLLLTYLVFVFKPSLARFLTFSVMEEVNTETQARTNSHK